MAGYGQVGSAITHARMGGAFGLIAVTSFKELAPSADELSRELRRNHDRRLKKQLPWWCAAQAAAPTLMC